MSDSETAPPMQAAMDAQYLIPNAETSDIEERYELLSIIGQGCFGTVRKIRDKLTDTEYACKTLNKNQEDACPHHILQREVASLRQVQTHPHLIELQAVYESDDHIHIITEMTTGGELYDRIATGKWRVSEHHAAELITNILEAIAHCHERGVVHRDLKASNFLFVNEKTNTNIKIIDFGLSRRLKTLNDEEGGDSDVAWILKSQVGTPYYTAPEILTKDSYTSLCDIWSVGVIAYAVLTRGTLPFLGEDEDETIKLLKDPDVYADFSGDVWKNYTPYAKEFCKSLLQKDSSLRPTAKQALQLKWLHHHNSSLLTSVTESLIGTFWSLFETEEISNSKRNLGSTKE